MRSSILRRCLLVVTLVCFLSQAYALEIGEQQVDITASSSFVSRYIWRGQDLYGNNDPAIQPSVDLTLPGVLAGIDVGLNVWGSFPLTSGHDDATELDYTFSLSRDILDGAVSISGGYTYFDYPRAGGTWDVQETWLSLSVNDVGDLPLPVNFSVFAGYDIEGASGGIEDGWYYSWGFDTEFPLPEWAIFQEEQILGLGVTNWGNDGVAGLEPSALYATELSLSTSYSFGDLGISPSVTYVINHEDAINSGDEEIWFGFELSYAF